MSQASSWLLVSDVDDTLVGDDDGLAALCLALVDSSCQLALNSSRPIASIKKTLQSLNTHVDPVAVIGAMGTEIELRGQRLDQWSERFNGWSRAPIDAIMSKFGHEPHIDEYQTPFKASFAVNGEGGVRSVEASLAENRINVKLIASGGNGALDVDILPPGADKGEAACYLARMLGIDHDHMIVAGDSRNDLEMFLKARKGIVVGNARDELRNALENCNDEIYFSRLPQAWGLLEGLTHYQAVQVDGTSERN